jgi:hypothetical protein
MSNTMQSSPSSSRRRLRFFFRVLSIVPGVPLTLLIAAAGVGPDDALANLRKWANTLGIEQLPPWLTALITNYQLLWAALLALLLYIALMIVIFYAYPIWIRALVALIIFLSVGSIIPLLFFPESITVERWMPASDDTTMKAVLPAEIFADWETKKHTADDLTQPDTEQRLVPQEMLQDLESKRQRVNDLTHQLQKLAAQQLAYGKPPSASADFDPLKLQEQIAGAELTEAQLRVNDVIGPKADKAVSERTAAQAHVEQYLRQQLGTGKLIARGIPNDAPPHDNEQIIIKPAQWQYLRLSISTADATDNKGGTVFKGVEIGKSKKRPDLP